MPGALSRRTAPQFPDFATAVQYIRAIAATFGAHSDAEWSTLTDLVLNELRPCGVDSRGPITLDRVESRHFDDTRASVAALFASCQDAANQVRERGEGRQKAVCIARAARASPRYQCADRHMAELRSEGWSQRLLEERVIDSFLKCGDPHHGFARAYCDECKHDFLIAYSCPPRGLSSGRKGRAVCPSCNISITRRGDPAHGRDGGASGFHGMAVKWMPDRIAVFARYDGDLCLGLEAPARVSSAASKIIKPWKERPAREPRDLVELFETVRALSQLGEDVLVYPDAEEFLAQALHSHRMSALVAEIRRDPRAHPLRRDLLKSELLPYQLDGIAFAAGAGRAVLADEMGLGKTIQGVGVAELLARHSGIGRVLVVCPASLKSQWRAEIGRFCAREVQLVSGKSTERSAQYAGGAFFTVCNYEQVLRDFLDIERSKWDLIILDEAQRIKNWEAKTSRIIKGLRSPFALVLTGTPLENRLDDLYSVVEFIDPRRLGPAYRFIHRHRVASETGKVLGYKNLEALRAHLKPVLLRRTRASVAQELPRRTTEIIRVTPTDEQLELHNARMQLVVTITHKPFLTEMDLLRLQKALLLARMSANSTALVDKQLPGYSTKLERVGELIETLCAEPARKILVFSEWTSMLDLIEPLLKRAKAEFVRLDGSVPQKQRSHLVATFQSDANCRAFLTTNAGSTGLNLQAADTVINVELPWNPALLEQRIARAHRMGQKRAVQVYLMVTENTIEENLLATLSAKHELAAAVLDPDSELREVSLASGMEELKRRLEMLLGAKPEGSPDESMRERTEADAIALAQRKERVAEAGGQLLAAAFSFLGEILPDGGSKAPAPQAVAALRAGLAECVETAEDGKLRLAVTLPGMQSLDALAAALAKLMAARESGGCGRGGRCLRVLRAMPVTRRESASFISPDFPS